MRLLSGELLRTTFYGHRGIDFQAVARGKWVERFTRRDERDAGGGKAGIGRVPPRWDGQNRCNACNFCAPRRTVGGSVGYLIVTRTALV